MFMSQISPSIHFLSYTIFVRCFVSRLYQPSKMYWVGYPLFIFSGRVCNIGTVSPLTVWQNIPVRPSGPAVFFVEYFLSYGFHFLNSYRIVEVFCFCVTFDKSYFSRNFPIASKMSFFFFGIVLFSVSPRNFSGCRIYNCVSICIPDVGYSRPLPFSYLGTERLVSCVSPFKNQLCQSFKKPTSWLFVDHLCFTFVSYFVISCFYFIIPFFTFLWVYFALLFITSLQMLGSFFFSLSASNIPIVRLQILL